MKPVEGYYKDLKMTSMEAVKKFENESIDFVFIDGSHEYEDIKNDIISWMPKVKKGGVLAGHDYYLSTTCIFLGIKKLYDSVNFDYMNQINNTNAYNAYKAVKETLELKM